MLKKLLNKKIIPKATKAIAIAAHNNYDFTSEPCSPCGSCRQVLLEMENKQGKPFKVIMFGKEKIYEIESAKSLLPVSFGKESLSE